MENPTALIVPMLIVAAIFLVIGVLLGVLLSGLLSPADKDTKSGRLKPLLRVWRDSKSQQLLLEVGGEKYDTRSQLGSDRLQQLAKLTLEMRIWLGATSAAELQSLSKETRQNPSPDKPAAPPIAGVVTAPAQPEVMKWERSQEVKPVSTDIAEVISSVVSGKGTRTTAPSQPATVAGQIDAIVQERLLDSPLRQRDIRLVDDPSGGVVVWVGTQRFESVEEVTDPEVKALLRQCVQEWERRYYRE